MFGILAARVLFGMGVVCLCLAFAVELQAANKYCWKTEYAHCGYHPCTCEDGTDYFGCAEATTHGPTGWCHDGGTTSCTADTEHCGDKISYPFGTCGQCIYGTQQVGTPCNKWHDCETN